MHLDHPARRGRALTLAVAVGLTATACRAPYAPDGQDFRPLESVDFVPGDSTNTIPAGAPTFTVRLVPGGTRDAEGRTRVAQLDNFAGIGPSGSYRWNDPDGGANPKPGLELFIDDTVIAAAPSPDHVDLTIDLAALRAAGVDLVAGDNTLCVYGGVTDTSGQGQAYFPWQSCDTVRLVGTTAPTTTPPATTPPSTVPPTAPPSSVSPAFVPVPEPAAAIRPAGTFGAVSLANDADGDTTYQHHEQAPVAGATVPVRFTVQNPGAVSLFVQSVTVVVDGVAVPAPDCASWVGAQVDPTHGFTCDAQVTAGAAGVTRTVDAIVSLSQMAAPFGVSESEDSTEITTRS